MLFCSCKHKIQNARKEKTNIIFIFPDQLRSDYVGAKGGEFAYTPNIDRLAKEGVLFNRAYSASPTCTPARAALLTGMAPWNNGLLGFAPMARTYKYEMPQMLRDAGYYTFATGKLHYKPITGGKLRIPRGKLDNSRYMHGFHEIKLCEGWPNPQNAYNKWFAEKAPDKNIDGTGLGAVDHRGGIYPYEDVLHPTAWTANQAIDFLKNYESKNPYFLKVAFHRPHPPFDPPKRWFDFYKNRSIPNAIVGDWSKEKYAAFNKAPSPEEQQNAPRGNYGDQIIRQSRIGYLAAISFLDEQIGRIIDELEKRGELENTLIVISSDHGDMMGDHHLWRKAFPYEGSAGVPMIMRWPESLGIGTKRGKSIEKLVELRDILPTFLDVAGVQVPKEMDGRSMLDLLRGKQDSWRKELDMEHSSCYWTENSWTGLIGSRYKYIYFNRTGEEQLFDIKKDPQEVYDLSKEDRYKKVLLEWREKMIAHLSERGDPWVVNGKLGILHRAINYSPNYPMAFFPEELLNKPKFDDKE